MESNPQNVKQQSEEAIRRLGGSICDWLPELGRTAPRSSLDAANRALVLNAMTQIHLGAPTDVIARWLVANDLLDSLSESETEILALGNGGLTEQILTNLYWYLESLWALAWAGGLTNELSIGQPVGDELASHVPNLQLGEPAEGFRSTYRLRSAGELCKMLDLYFRAHWYTEDGRINGYPTGLFDPDIVMERRKALQWLFPEHGADWDHIDLST